MIHAILTFLHLIVNRLMLLSLSIHRLCHLISILFQPLYNGTFERLIRSFSRVIFYYYSSNGACYTLQDRTRHLARSVQARWTRKSRHNQDDDLDIFYDALDETEHWL